MLSENDILDTYPWLTDNLFQRIIYKDYPNVNTIVVKSFSVRAALEPGENYASTMIRARVNYTIDHKLDVEKGFIIKAGHSKESVREMLKEMNLFEKEITMFRDVLPQVEQLLISIGDDTKLSAKCYEVSNDIDEPFIIFEDLSIRGYKNVNRRLGLDVVHYKLALAKIARWHAANAVLLETTNYENCPIVHDFECILKNKLMKQMTESAMRVTSKFIATLPKYKHLSAKIADSPPKIWLKILRVTDFKPNDFITLCHGDLWMNNMLFQFDENAAPVDALLCDYQAPYLGCPILDVLNTLFTSSSIDTSERDWDLLLQYYHSELSTVLKKLNYSKAIPTLTELQVDFLEKGVISLCWGLMSPGARYLENTGEDVTTFLGEDDESDQKNYNMMANPKSRKNFEFMLDYFDRKGYFG